MKKKKKSNGLFVALAVVFALLGIYFGMDYIHTEESEPEDLFYKINIADLQTVSMESADYNYTLVRDGDTWTCVELPEADISESQVEYKLEALDEINAVRRLETPAELSVYGLEEPAFRITFAMADGSETVVLLGNMAPDGNDYAMMEGDTSVCTISTIPRLTLSVTPDSLIQAEEE